METAIGVFDSPDKAGEALRDLLRQNVPRESIVFLTRSENEAVTVAEEFGACARGFITERFLAKVTAVTPLNIPGTGPVYILGAAASALQGLLSPDTGSALDKAESTDVGIPETSRDSENVALFHMILRSGRSIILVRTAWREIATVAPYSIAWGAIGPNAHIGNPRRRLVRPMGVPSWMSGEG